MDRVPQRALQWWQRQDEASQRRASWLVVCGMVYTFHYLVYCIPQPFFTEDAAKLITVSLGQAQEPVAEKALGQMYAEGKGTARDDSRALVLISRATGLGSAHACYVLGFYYERGALGLRKDLKETGRWYRKSQASAVQDASEVTRQKVADWLRDHPDLA